MKLQESDDAYFSLDLDDPGYHADLISDLPCPSTNTEVITTERLTAVQELEQEPMEEPEQEHEEGEDSEEMVVSSILCHLLHYIPLEKFKDI
jgi:hypothetical protein